MEIPTCEMHINIYIQYVVQPHFYRELPQIDAVDMISMCRCGGVAEPKLDFSYPPLCGV